MSLRTRRVSTAELHPHNSIGVRLISSVGGPTSGDDWLAEELPSGVLRLAAIDGVTAHPDSVAPAGADSAVWAAGVVRTALRADLEPGAALLAAHAVLYDAAVAPSRARASAAVAVADVTRTVDGRLDVAAVGAADCFVAVRSAGVWSVLVGGDHYSAAGRARWSEVDATHFPHCERCLDPHQFCDDVPRLEGEFVDDASWRECPAVGRDATLRLRRGHAAGVDAVVVSTDGLDHTGELENLDEVAGQRLDAARVRDITVLAATPS